jgi:hypothetical protein
MTLVGTRIGIKRDYTATEIAFGNVDLVVLRIDGPPNRFVSLLFVFSPDLPICITNLPSRVSFKYCP